MRPIRRMLAPLAVVAMLLAIFSINEMPL